jgi:hypothetical protein
MNTAPHVLVTLRPKSGNSRARLNRNRIEACPQPRLQGVCPSPTYPAALGIRLAICEHASKCCPTIGLGSAVV